MSVRHFIQVIAIATLFVPTGRALSQRTSPTTRPSIALAMEEANPPVVSTAQPATTHRPAGAPWSITVPPGWVIEDAEYVTMINEGARHVAQCIPGMPKVVYTLMIASGQNDGRFALVQRGPALPPDLSFEAVHQGSIGGYKQGADMVAKSNSLDMKQGGITADPDRRVLIARSEVPDGAGGHLALVSITHFGNTESATVHCYAPTGAMPAAEPAMLELAHSLAFDPGAEYIYGTSTGGFDWGSIAGKALIGGIIGALLGLGSWLFKRLSGKSPA